MSAVSLITQALGIITNPFNWGTSSSDNRWHPPMTTDITKLGDYGTPEEPFGEKDGDHPIVLQSTVGSPETGFIDTYTMNYGGAETVSLTRDPK